MDTAPDSCIPWETPYASAFGSGYVPFSVTIENIIAECEANNQPGTCQSMTCEVEGYFLQSWFTYAVFGGETDYTKLHSQGFDVNSECPTSPGRGISTVECCGQYPVRYPYRHVRNQKECCG